MNGFAIINKPVDMSSSDVVIKCRNALSKAVNQKIKCGHMGTLDPMASGVLIVAFGNTTRLFDYLLDKKKSYIATFVFGEERDTLDATGKTTGFSGLPEYKDIENAIDSFVGVIEQVPPKFSAVNINGKRAYDLVRSGKEFDIKAKKVRIDKINILGKELIDDKCKEIKLEIVCGGGTYIRSICRDIAYKTNTLAFMSALERTSCGGYSTKESCELKDFLGAPLSNIKDTKELLAKIMPTISLNDIEYKKIRNGQIVKKDISDGLYGAEYNKKLCFIIKACDGQIKSDCFLEEANE